MFMKLAPVIILVYARLDHTCETIEALKKNRLASETEVFIYSDYPKNKLYEEKVFKVRNYISKIKGFKKINYIYNKENKGIDIQTKDAVTEVLKKFGKVIVIEDDCITSNNFLDYMNQMLDKYEKKEEIAMIAGFKADYNFKRKIKEDIFFSDGVSSWGWGTWQNRWEKIDWNYYKNKKIFENRKEERKFKKDSGIAYNCLKIDPTTWDITFNFWVFKNKKIVVYPVESKVKNIGVDGSGVHFKQKRLEFLPNSFNINDKKVKFIIPEEIKLEIELIKEIRYFNRLRIRNRIGIFLKRIRLYKYIKPLKDKLF